MLVVAGHKKREMQMCQLFAAVCTFFHSLSPGLSRFLSTAAVPRCRRDLSLQVIVNSLFRPLRGHISLLLCPWDRNIYRRCG